MQPMQAPQAALRHAPSPPLGLRLAAAFRPAAGRAPPCRVLVGHVEAVAGRPRAARPPRPAPEKRPAPAEPGNSPDGPRKNKLDMWVQGPAAGRQAWLQGAAKLRRPAGSAPTLPTACSLPRPPPPARSWKRQLARLPANPRAVAVVQLLRIEEEGAFVGLVGGSPGKAGSTDTQVWWPPNTRLPMHGAVPWCTSSCAYGCPRHILSSYSPQPHGGRSGRQNFLPPCRTKRRAACCRGATGARSWTTGA